jgi:hypothetical protein
MDDKFNGAVEWKRLTYSPRCQQSLECLGAAMELSSFLGVSKVDKRELAPVLRSRVLEASKKDTRDGSWYNRALAIADAYELEMAVDTHATLPKLEHPPSYIEPPGLRDLRTIWSLKNQKDESEPVRKVDETAGALTVGGEFGVLAFLGEAAKQRYNAPIFVFSFGKRSSDSWEYGLDVAFSGSGIKQGFRIDGQPTGIDLRLGIHLQKELSTGRVRPWIRSGLGYGVFDSYPREGLQHGKTRDAGLRGDGLLGIAFRTSKAPAHREAWLHLGAGVFGHQFTSRTRFDPLTMGWQIVGGLMLRTRDSVAPPATDLGPDRIYPPTPIY